MAYAIDDRDVLSPEMNAHLDEVLESDEAVLVAIPGERGTGIAGTDRRAFIWKHHTLSAHDYADLSGIACSTGNLRWVQLLGAGLDDRKPTLINITRHAAAILTGVTPRKGDERTAAGRLKELVEASVTTTSTDGIHPMSGRVDETQPAVADRLYEAAFRTIKSLGQSAINPGPKVRAVSYETRKAPSVSAPSLSESDDDMATPDDPLDLPCVECGQVSSTRWSSASLSCPGCQRTFAFLACDRCGSANQIVTPIPRAAKVRCAFCGGDELAALATAGLRWRALERRHLLDGSSDTVLVGGFTVIGGAELGVEAGTVCSLTTSPDCLRLHVEIGRPGALQIPYDEITDLELSGGEKGYSGPRVIGFGIEELAASALTTLLQVSNINTGMRIATGSGELHLHSGQWTPEELRFKLSPLWTRFESAHRSPATNPTPDARSQEVSLLSELAKLHAAGVLTDEEYAAKKAELLARM